MKTAITTTDKNTIAQGFSNPFGMVISNNPEVRKAVADHAKGIIAKLHAEKRNNLNNK